MCPTNDYERLSKLVYAANAKGLWRNEFGFCFPTETPDNTFSNPERERYVGMLETHASAQLSYGSAPIGGLRAARDGMELRRLPAADNSARRPVTVSTKKVMQEMKLKTECFGSVLERQTKDNPPVIFLEVMAQPRHT